MSKKESNPPPPKGVSKPPPPPRPPNRTVEEHAAQAQYRIVTDGDFFKIQQWRWYCLKKEWRDVKRYRNDHTWFADPGYWTTKLYINKKFAQSQIEYLMKGKIPPKAEVWTEVERFYDE